MLEGFHPWQQFTRLPLREGAYCFHGQLVLTVTGNELSSRLTSSQHVHYYQRLTNGQLKPLEQLEFTNRLMGLSVTTAAHGSGSIGVFIYIAPYATEQQLETVVSLALGISPT